MPWNPYDSVRLGLTSLPNAAAQAAGGLYTRGTGAGQINQQANGQIDANIERVRNGVLNVLVSGRMDSSVGAMATGTLTAAAIAADAITAAKVASDVSLEIADAVWDEVMSGHTTLGTAGQILSAGLVSGAVNDAGATTTDFDTDGFTETSDDHFNQSLLVFTSGALKGQCRLVTNYVGTGQNVQFDEPFSEAPANNDEFVIVPGPRVWTGYKFPELGVGAPAATPFGEEFAMLFYMALRNKHTVSGSLLQIFNDAGTAIIQAALSVAAGVFTRDKMASA